MIQITSSQVGNAGSSSDGDQGAGRRRCRHCCLTGRGRKKMAGEDAAAAAAAEEETGEIRIHVTALDEIVSVNSFFTGAVFIGLSLNNNNNLVAKGPADPCNASKHLLRQMVLWEVLAFSCYLMSSLVAQGLKLHLTICSVKLNSSSSSSTSSSSSSSSAQLVVARYPSALRWAMATTALGSVGGTVFLMLSMINAIQLRLGVLSCYSVWSKEAVIPLVVLVSSGVLVFISAVVMAFRI